MKRIMKTIESTTGAAFLIAAALWPLPALANEVTGVDYELDGEQVVFKLTTSETAPRPNVFTTEQPPRIVLELPDTASRVPAGRDVVSIGPAQAVTTLSAGGRTRMVVELSHRASYEYTADGNEVTLSVAAGNAAIGAAAPDQPVEMPARSASGAPATIREIDFRRGEGGSGRVIVRLDGPGANASVRERGARVVVDLFNTRLNDGQRQRLDVMDFATPVRFITPEQRGDNVRMVLEVSGAYQHMSYQTGDQLVIEVSRPEVEQEASADRELQFFEERTYEGTRITLNFQDIEVRSVLQLIADVSGLNIVVSDTVDGNLTLRLTNVPWDQALDIILETRHLDMRQSGNVIWIAPADEIARREQQLLQARADRETLEPLHTNMIDISYANAEDLAALIRAGEGMLSERGSVTIDQRTNTLLVTDTVEKVEGVQGLVAELDRPVRQVLIESRIVIANHDFNHQLGVRFGVTASREDKHGNVYTTGSNLGVVDGIQRGVTNRRRDPDSGGAPLPSIPNRLNVNLPTTIAPAGSMAWSILAADYLLDLELSALESENEGEVISTPRVITANQAEAFIQQGVEIPYEEATSAGATAVQFKEAVLELRVVPLITPDNRVQLDLNVKQDTVGELFETGRGGSVPSIDTRELGTKVLVENGQTVVLGGIFQDDRRTTRTKVPMLGDVPVLGVLFRRRTNHEQKRELLIFVTPTILDDRIVLD